MARHTKTLARSFAGGEMSPEMFSRMDDAKFQSGAETLLNCVARPTGAVARRTGTRMVRETRDPDQASKLLSFVFSQTDSAVIEAGRATIDSLDSGYFRFFSNGETLLYSQPDKYVPSAQASVNGGIAGAYPCLTVSCSIDSPMVVTISTGHALANNNQVIFVGDSRTLPDAGVTANADRPLVGVPYYVVVTSPTTFTLTKTLNGTAINCTEHAGYGPVIYNFDQWSTRYDIPRQSLVIPEHRIQNKEPVALTMWPTSLSPDVKWLNPTRIDVLPVTGGYAHGLAKTAVCAQQVLFSATTGTLPPNIEEGKLYWITGWTVGLGWTISETFNGPTFNAGGVGSGEIKICALPELIGGSLGAQGKLECATRYYAIANASDPSILKLEASIGEGQVANGGLVFSPVAHGCGPFRVHRAYEVGEIASYGTSSGMRSFYCRKSWWDPEPQDAGVLTSGIDTAAVSRVPSTRTSLQQAAYWQELEGRTTGGLISVTADEYGVGTDLLLTSTSGTHGFATGMPVALVDGTAPSGATIDQLYYAIVDNPTQLRLATSYAAALAAGASPSDDAIDGPTTETPRWGGLLLQGFIGYSGDSILWPSHGLSSGDTVVFTDAADVGNKVTTSPDSNFDLGTVYYVREALTDSFQISATPAGATITLGGDGAFITAVGNSIYEVPHDYSAAEIQLLGTTQSGDVMSLASQDHPLQELRRLTASTWDLQEVDYVAAAPVPGACYEVDVSLGEGSKIWSTSQSTTNRVFHTVEDHALKAGDPVRVTGLGTVLADGYYIVMWPSGVPNFETRLFLRDVESGVSVLHTGATSGLDGRVRRGTNGEDTTQSYKITAIDSNNEESAPNDAFEVTCNLFVPGSYATIGWGESKGATRYRVYKEINGLYGLIGETDDLQFKDDNVGPDLAVTPPILDDGLRRVSAVSFDSTADTVGWVDHSLPAGTPIVFRTTDQLPGLNEGQTYYVLSPGDDSFQVTATYGSTTAVVITGTDTGRHIATAGNFPSAVTYFEGRRVFGGSRVQPQDIWLTASGTEADLSYSIPTVDTDRIYFRVSSREISAVRHLIPLSQLVLLSDSTEYRLTPLNDDVVTPSSISVRPQSYVGAGLPSPSLVNNTVVFAAARGGHMRELGYSADVLGYLTGDLSLRAGHLFDGYTIVDQAYSKAPLPVVWCVSSSGKLLGITYIPEEAVGAWHQHTTDGTFESVTVVPEGDVDAVYVVVQRTLAGVGTKRYVERFADTPATVTLADSFFVDCGLTYDGIAATVISGLDHLEGETVAYLADGLPGTAVVASGAITLATAASKVHVGLPFTSDLKTLPLSMMKVDAFGTGRQKNINQVWVRIFESGAFKAGPDSDDLRVSRSPADGAIVDGLVQVTLTGDWNDDGQILVRQDSPLPLTVSGLTLEVASGG